MSPEARRYTMSRIRSSGTKPELILGDLIAEYLAPGTELIYQPKNLPGKPDWWVPSLQLVFFADGCFFHGCPRHFVIPSQNQAYWVNKINRNKSRDREVNRRLKEMGLRPVRIWEHDLVGPDRRNARRRIRQALSSLALMSRHVSSLNEARLDNDHDD